MPSHIVRGLVLVAVAAVVAWSNVATTPVIVTWSHYAFIITPDGGRIQWFRADVGEGNPITGVSVSPDQNQVKVSMPNGRALSGPYRLTPPPPLLSRSFGFVQDSLRFQVANVRRLSLPLWPIATLFTGLVLIGPVIRYARRARRRRQNLCVACGYDLRGTPESCPECGRAAAARSTRRVQHSPSRSPHP
jgi:hypothetical protein